MQGRRAALTTRRKLCRRPPTIARAWLALALQLWRLGRQGDREAAFGESSLHPLFLRRLPSRHRMGI